MGSGVKKARRAAKNRALTARIDAVNQTESLLRRHENEFDSAARNGSNTVCLDGRDVPYRTLPSKSLMANYDSNRVRRLTLFASDLHRMLRQSGDERYMAVPLSAVKADDLLPEALCLLLGTNGIALASVLSDADLSELELLVEPGTPEDNGRVFRVFDAQHLLFCGPLCLLDTTDAEGARWAMDAVRLGCAYRAACTEYPGLRTFVSVRTLGGSGGDA